MTVLRQDKKDLEKNIAGLMVDFVKKYEPRAVFVNPLNKKPFVDKMKELKGSGLAFDYGVITEYPFKKEIRCKFCFWDGNILSSSSVIVVSDDIEIQEYVVYPIPVYNDLVRHIEGYGYFNGLMWGGKPLSVNKY